MSRWFPRRVFSLAQKGSDTRRLDFEVLENRALLSVASASNVEHAVSSDFGCERFEPASLLVRFRDGGSELSSALASLGNSAHLGSEIQRSFPLVPGLSQITLPAEVNV